MYDETSARKDFFALGGVINPSTFRVRYGPKMSDFVKIDVGPDDTGKDILDAVKREIRQQKELVELEAEEAELNAKLQANLAKQNS